MCVWGGYFLDVLIPKTVRSFYLLLLLLVHVILKASATQRSKENQLSGLSTRSLNDDLDVN